ncbi:hypothetical protein [Flavobacterium lacus]|uniref:NIPSNAP protein n=1 Tax=Flavobacterium lacus TaxID=1353778 RepID=A0A328WQ11_9FLAO|nr:hypothetical protein [Flavobacterium lacus]RAR48432.1 hypothetical protein B0I10_10540 [Flavobacterium lacus]
MKKLLFLVLLLPVIAMAQVAERQILTMSELTIKQGHNEQFKAGVKMYKECYEKNKGTESWNLWSRIQGEGTVYALTGLVKNWAELDKDDEAGKACRDIVINMIMPHIEKSVYHLASTMPEMSTKKVTPDRTVVWVTYFRVKNSTVFNATLKEVHNTLKAVEGDIRGSWYSFMGGAEDAPDYMVTTSYKDLAEMDIEKDGVWKIMENKHGVKKAEQVRNDFRGAIDDSWGYTYILNKEMSK